MQLLSFQTTRRHLRYQALPGQAVPLRLRGFEPKADGMLLFDRRYFDEPRATVAACASLGTRLSAYPLRTQGRVLEATEADLEAINTRHAEDALTADEIFVFERYVVNNVASRFLGILFTERALGKFAADFAEGRSRLLHHDSRQVVGTTFAAEVVEQTVRGVEGKWVRTREYMMRSERNDPVITDVRGGILKYDSIGLHLGRAVDFIDLDERSYIRIDYDESEQAPLEAEEVSFVYLGEIKGAGSGKHAAQAPTGATGPLMTPDPATRRPAADRPPQTGYHLCFL